jgi:hypothetical protein
MLLINAQHLCYQSLVELHKGRHASHVTSIVMITPPSLADATYYDVIKASVLKQRITHNKTQNLPLECTYVLGKGHSITCQW